jgi:hypothetical protein
MRLRNCVKSQGNIGEFQMTLRNIWLIGTLLVAAIGIGWLFTAKAHAGSCTTNTHVSQDQAFEAAFGPDGANIPGTAACPESKNTQDDALAVSAALSSPVWLETGERASVSGGLGFTEDSTAVGLNGIYRIDKGLSGFAGGAMSTSETDVWAGKAGLRLGW